ncbi:hypothetical protein vBEcoMWL3_gp129 [Escherichia phage vB_EcoM_WL-3]|nr:hypothetical protein vBEcoMWL3_gp129 [Escherichia phage vB_EcoM_WL-3]
MRHFTHFIFLASVNKLNFYISSFSNKFLVSFHFDFHLVLF